MTLEKAMKIITRRLLRRKGVRSAQDINNGLCEEWAMSVCDAVSHARLFWIDELAPVGEGEWYQHCVVKFRGRFYDAEIPSGVKSWEQLPYVVRQNEEMSRQS